MTTPDPLQIPTDPGSPTASPVPLVWPSGDPPALKSLAIDTVRFAVEAYRHAVAWEKEVRQRQAGGQPQGAWRSRSVKKSKLRLTRRWESLGNLADAIVCDAKRRLIEAIAAIDPSVDWSAEPGQEGYPWQPRAVVLGRHCYALVVDPDQPEEDPTLVVTRVRKISRVDA